MEAKALVAAMGAFALAGAAHAGVAEVHVGVLAHNIEVTNPKNANKEDGPVIEGQINFDSPGFLHWAGAPQPYLVGSLNVTGDTSFAGGGLEWHLKLGERWRLSPGLGLVVHDGDVDNPYPNGTPQADQYGREHLLLGSRTLFRTSLGLSRDFSEHWSGEVFFSHLSHGQILASGRNQGLDQAGVRIGYRFRD